MMGDPYRGCAAITRHFTELTMSLSHKPSVVKYVLCSPVANKADKISLHLAVQVTFSGPRSGDTQLTL